ncbi:MAG: zinc ribbon domain-containing protein [Methanoregula sp.]|jgi:predicted RNA-binding Zn-ribbon protein involved in translation (DUF1610 family)|uniref:zinc ribbon domain-containing protein n=1 Tax=Methanoregula sp. TaxID=2052170 RepID=UPI0025D547A4|nr:zinc ribbon domain-containing protein [Methanoregula sp.]MCK9631965.1 zinc ribbon domain-containing protein [Methanoregula sp.]
MKENYFKLLGLSFDPPETNTAVITSAIEKKRAEWNQLTLSSPNPQKYSLLVSKLDEIKQVMLDANSRLNHLNEVNKIEFAELDSLLAHLSVKGHIEQKEIDGLSKKFGFARKTIEKRITVKIIANQGSTSCDQKQEPDPVIIRQVEDNLKNYNQFHSTEPPINTLYEFIALITKKPELAGAPADELRKNAEAKTQEYQRSGTASDENIIIKNLCAQCGVLFCNETEKKKYDNYLEGQKLKGIYAQIDDLGKISDTNLTNGKTVLSIIKKISEVSNSSEEAKRVFVDYCKKKKYVFALPTDDSIQKIHQCFFCGVAYVQDQTAVKCTKCGNPLVIQCPKCGTVNDHSNNNCKNCSFEISKMRLVGGLCDAANRALEQMDFDNAERNLTKANEYWPGNERIKTITGNLTNLRKRCEDNIKNLKGMIQEKQYYSAQAELKRIKQTVSGYSDPGIENEINEHITTAEKWIKKARSLNDEGTIIDCCSRAFKECKDHPEITPLLKQYPVAAPSQLSCSADTRGCMNTLSWNASIAAGNIIYRIVRKRDSLPLSPIDGDLIQDERSCHFLDKKVEPGIRYFYSVFSFRAGIYSSPVSTNNGIINFTDISSVSISPENRKITVTWKVPNNSQSIGIWKKQDGQPAKAGDGTPVGCISKSSFSDTSVQNDVTYGYIVCVKYSDGKTEVWSPGFRFSATPSQPPDPVEIKSITKIDDDTYEATWTPVSRGEISLYLSKTAESRDGSVISDEELTRQYKPIPFQSHTSTSARFRLVDFINYIVPVITTPNSSVLGATLRISKVGCVRNLTGKIYNNRILLEFEWPEKISKVCCLYRNDTYPVDVNDPAAVKIPITKEQYAKENAITFRYVEGKRFYISIFSVYIQNNEEVCSDAVNYTLKGSKKALVKYDIALSKGFFSKKYSCSITAECDQPTWELPTMVLVGRDRVTPLQKEQGTILGTIPAGKLSGKNNTYDFTFEDGIRDMRLKIFFKRNEDYDEFSLIAKNPEKHRIS